MVAIVIGGTFIGYNGFARGGVARVLANGALDPSFDSGVSALVETFSRWHCNITARSFSAVASFSAPGPIAPLLPASFGDRLARFRI